MPLSDLKLSLFFDKLDIGIIRNDGTRSSVCSIRGQIVWDVWKFGEPNLKATKLRR